MTFQAKRYNTKHLSTSGWGLGENTDRCHAGAAHGAIHASFCATHILAAAPELCTWERKRLCLKHETDVGYVVLTAASTITPQRASNHQQHLRTTRHGAKGVMGFYGDFNGNV